MSFFRKFKTSPALTPNYSIEPKKLCSTSHMCVKGSQWPIFHNRQDYALQKKEFNYTEDCKVVKSIIRIHTYVPKDMEIDV